MIQHQSHWSLQLYNNNIFYPSENSKNFPQPAAQTTVKLEIDQDSTTFKFCLDIAPTSNDISDAGSLTMYEATTSAEYILVQILYSDSANIIAQSDKLRPGSFLEQCNNADPTSTGCVLEYKKKCFTFEANKEAVSEGLTIRLTGDSSPSTSSDLDYRFLGAVDNLSLSVCNTNKDSGKKDRT